MRVLLITLFFLGNFICIESYAADSVNTKFSELPEVKTEELRLIEYCQKGTDYFSKGDLLLAATTYENGLKQYPNSAMLCLLLGDTYRALNRDSSAIAYLDKTLLKRQYLVSEIDSVPHLFSSNEKEVKIALLLAEAYSGIAEILCKTDRYKRALLNVKESIKLLEDHAETKDGKIRLSYLHNLRGRIYVGRQNSNKAIKSFEKAIDFDPSNPNSYVNIATVLLERGMNAIMVQRSFVGMQNNGLNPSNPPKTPPTNNIPQGQQSRERVIAYVNTSTLEKAMTYCDKAIKLKPTFGYAYLTRAEIKKQLKRKDYCDDAFYAKKYGMPNVMEILQGNCW